MTKALAPIAKPKQAIKKIIPMPKVAAKAPAVATTKADTILGLLRRPTGATVADLASATTWQLHSVRGFLSGTLKKKRGLTLLSERVDGVLRYRLPKGS